MRTSLLTLQLTLLICSTTLTGCLLFSPYASPVVKPLKRGEIEVKAGAGAIPRFFSDGRADVGVEGGVTFSPLDRLMIGGRLWSSTEVWDDKGFRINGYGVDASLLLSDPSERDSWRVAPAVHFQFDTESAVVEPTSTHPGPVDSGASTVNGVGYGIGLNVWTPTSSALNPVLGATLRRYGFGAEGVETIYVVTFGMHGGIGYDITDNFNLGAELVVLYEYPESELSGGDVSRSVFFTPMIRAGLRF